MALYNFTQKDIRRLKIICKRAKAGQHKPGGREAYRLARVALLTAQAQYAEAAGRYGQP